MDGRTRLGAILAVVVGFLAFGWGLTSLLDPHVRCGGQGIYPGDTCVTRTVRGGDVSSDAHTYSQRDLDEAMTQERVMGGAGVVFGAALFLGACYVATRDSRTGRPVRARLALTAEEARAGATKPVGFRARTLCTRCGGSGVRVGTARARCVRCLGSGRGLPGRHSVSVRIPGGVRDGSTLRVRGRGAPGGRAEPDGDLMLTVRIVARQRPGSRPSPPRPRTEPPPARTESRPAPPPPQERVVTPRAGEARPGRSGATGPVTVTGDGVRITVDRECVTVHEERGSRTRRGTWVITRSVRWPDIALLEFDSDRHDPVVALYAVPARPGSGRQHLADSRTFASGDWEILAAAVERLSHGRLVLDLSRREDTRGPRDS
ncbi:DnaJ C-terminal domain-containing protein [Streptomyces sp. NPDC007164]|uniref:DnaJ C-terminal domain-containing protein n=1 Tax=Streptomyces sp. NPDC007164 TaxID=3156918 RepID=UPI0033CC46F5